MTRKERELLAWLQSSAVHFYTDEERQAAQLNRYQTSAEGKTAERLYPHPTPLKGAALTDGPSLAAWHAADLANREKRFNYRDPVEPLDRAAILVKLARRGARADYGRTDPFPASVVGEPLVRWDLLERELRKRFGA